MEPHTFEVDPDIRFAAPPPFRLWTDPDWFRAAVDRVLARSWHAVANASVLPAPETAARATLLPGALDQPLVLTRDRKERLHALVDSCSHRGTPVCGASGPKKLLTCPLHGRTFRLDGELLAAPGFDDGPGFPSPSDNLPRVPVATWGPLLFAGIAPTVPFADWIEPLRCAADEHASAASVPSCDAAASSASVRGHDGPVATEVRASWIACVDRLLDAMAPAAVRMFRHGALCADAGATRVWLPPTTFAQVAGSGLSVLAVQPAAVDRTHIVEYAFGASGTPWRLDPELLEGLHRGLASHAHRGRRSGRYSPATERLHHHFHRSLAAALSGTN